MALLLSIRRTLINNIKIKQIFLQQKAINTTPPLLWLNQNAIRSAWSKQKETRYKEKDRVPQSFNLIYRAPMQLYLAGAMHVSTITASIITCVSIYQYVNPQAIVEPFDSALLLQNDDVYYFAAGFIAINAVIRMVVSMFPLRIYKDQGKYLAVYHSQLPGGLSYHNFLQGQVEAAYYMFSPWNNATYKLGTKTSLIFEDYFKTHSEFHKMREIEEKT